MSLWVGARCVPAVRFSENPSFLGRRIDRLDFSLLEVSGAVGTGHSEGACLCMGWFGEGVRREQFGRTFNQMLKVTISCGMT